MKIHLPVSRCAFRASPIAFCIVFSALSLSSFATGGFPDDGDIGSPAHAGSSSYNSGTGAYTVEGGGADIYGTADQFHFLHRGWDGDVRLITRVDSVGATKPWAKAGLMIRDTTAADSRNVDFILSSSHGVQLTHRATTGGSTASDVIVPGVSAPYWLKLERHGNTFAGWESPDGLLWFLSGAATFTMNTTGTHLGLSLTANDDAQLNTSVFSNASVDAAPAWTDVDIGTDSGASATTVDYATDLYTMNGAGADVYGTSDEFRFYYQPWSGDGTFVAHVLSVQNTQSHSKAGLMVRKSLAANSAHATIDVTAGSGIEFLRRTADGGSTSNTVASGLTAPYFLKLVRSGDSFSAYYSSDGGTWTQLGSAVTIAMSGAVYVGLDSCSTQTGTASTATFESVYFWAPDSVPAITTSTLPGTVVGESYNQALAATGGNGALVWSLDSGSLPAGLSLSSAGVITGTPTTAGTGSFTVQVADSDGIAGAGDEDTQALGIVVTADSVPAVTTTTLPGGVVGTAYSQPLAATGGNGTLVWSLDSGSLPTGLSLSSAGVISGTPTAVGTGSFTVRVADSDGITGTGDEDTQALGIVIAANLGDFSADDDIGSPTHVGAASYDSGSGTYTVEGGGADIYGTADQFHFLHQGWNGDVRLIARVDSIEATKPWAKAGLMIRDTTAADSRNVDFILSSSHGVQFTHRATAGGSTVSDAVVAGASAPYWLKLERHGNTFAGWESPDGLLWSLSGAATFTMNTTGTQVGLSLTANDDAQLNTSVFSNVSVDAAPAWTDVDIGTDSGASATTVDYATDLYTMNGAGANVYGTSDEFRFYYQPWSGDGTFVVRVLSVQNTQSHSKAGLMVRKSLAADSAQATIDVTAGSGIEFLRRTADGGSTSNTVASGLTAPYFLKLVRSGDSFSAYYSSDGGTWTQLGAAVTIAMSGTVYVGLDSCSTQAGTASTATFESVYLGVAPDSAPAITTSTLPDGAVGTAYSQPLAATGGNGTLVWSLDSGSLPAGLSLSSTGVISGTPTAVGTGSFTVRVADSDGITDTGDEDTQALSIIVTASGGIAYRQLLYRSEDMYGATPDLPDLYSRGKYGTDAYQWCTASAWSHDGAVLALGGDSHSVRISLDGGTSFFYPRGLGLPIFSVSGLAFDANDRLYALVGCAFEYGEKNDLGGIYASDDYGDSWTFVKATVNPGNVQFARQSAFAFWPLTGTPTKVYCAGNSNDANGGTDYGQLHISTDGGDSFGSPTTLAWGTYGEIFAIVHGTSASTLYLATEKGLARSTNDGSSWSFWSSGLPSAPEVRSVWVDPDDGNHILCTVTSSNSSNQGVWESTNGTAFSRIRANNAHMLSVGAKPTSGQRILYVMTQTGTPEIRTAAGTWASITYDLAGADPSVWPFGSFTNSSRPITFFNAHPTNPTQCVAQGRTPIYTTNNGQDFVLAGAGFGGMNMRGIAWASEDPTTFWACLHDGGVLTSYDRGNYATVLGFGGTFKTRTATVYGKGISSMTGRNITRLPTTTDLPSTARGRVIGAAGQAASASAIFYVNADTPTTIRDLLGSSPTSGQSNAHGGGVVQRGFAGFRIDNPLQVFCGPNYSLDGTVTWDESAKQILGFYGDGTAGCYTFDVNGAIYRCSSIATSATAGNHVQWFAGGSYMFESFVPVVSISPFDGRVFARGNGLFINMLTDNGTSTATATAFSLASLFDNPPPVDAKIWSVQCDPLDWRYIYVTTRAEGVLPKVLRGTFTSGFASVAWEDITDLAPISLRGCKIYTTPDTGDVIFQFDGGGEYVRPAPDDWQPRVASINFTTQPANNETLGINGVTWTFKTSGATGNQSNIGASLAVTIGNLVTALNASGNSSLAPCTYTAYGSRVDVTMDDPAEDTTETFTVTAGTTDARISNVVQPSKRSLWLNLPLPIPHTTE